MDALKKYKIAKQCYFQIGGASCETVEGVGTYYDEYLCKAKLMTVNNTKYKYVNCDGSEKTLKDTKRTQIYICGKSILYLEDNTQSIDDIIADIKQIPGYDSNITYYINIGTISDVTYNIRNSFRFKEKKTVDTKGADTKGADTKAAVVDAKAAVVDAKGDKQTYHYIIIPNEKKELIQLYKSLVNKMSNSNTHNIMIAPLLYHTQSNGHIVYLDTITDSEDKVVYFLTKKDSGDSKEPA